MRPKMLFALFLLCCSAASPEADTKILPHEQLSEDILRELVNFETTAQRPAETLNALEAMSTRLEAAGFPTEDVQIVNPEPGVYGLVARYRSIASQEPLLLMAHMDVVPADPDAWLFAPFKFGKKDGYYFGRGTQDNKAGVAHLVSNFVRLKQEGFRPNRDLIMVLTGDEETDGRTIEWLTQEKRGMIAAEYALNTDAGEAFYDDQMQPLFFQVQISEKLYQTYRLSTTNPGGHSSLPRTDNAINQLAAALTKIAAYEFPAQISNSTRLVFRRKAEVEAGPQAVDLLNAATVNPDPASIARLSNDPYYNSQLRTTCIATEIEGGHAENALPRHASAIVNCRIMPGVAPEIIQAKLAEIIADEGVSIESIWPTTPSPPSELPASLLETLDDLAQKFWPGVLLLPEMGSGATDGLYVRNAGIPVYGVPVWFKHPDEDMSHGLNEKIGAMEFHEGASFWYQMLKRLSSP